MVIAPLRRTIVFAAIVTALAACADAPAASSPEQQLAARYVPVVALKTQRRLSRPSGDSVVRARPTGRCSSMFAISALMLPLAVLGALALHVLFGLGALQDLVQALGRANPS